jgi:hypothetical protein
MRVGRIEMDAGRMSVCAGWAAVVGAGAAVRTGAALTIESDAGVAMRKVATGAVIMSASAAQAKR